MKMISESMSLDEIRRREGDFATPPFQRDVVWGRPLRQALLDTIMRGWTLPKFYFWVRPGEPDKFYIVDGRQRLTSIRQFMNNELPLDAATAAAFGLPGKFYRDLPPAMRAKFDGFSVQYDKISEATEPEIKAFFLRLQQGMQLTSFEKLNAMDGGLGDFCRELLAQPFFQTSLAFANRRGSHLGIAARVMAVEINGMQSNLRAEDLGRVFETNAGFSSRSDKAAHMRRTMAFLERAFPQKTETLRDKLVIQSIVTLASLVVSTGKSAGHEKAFGAFIEDFMAELFAGQGAADSRANYATFARAAQGKSAGDIAGRHRAFLHEMPNLAPGLAGLVEGEIAADAFRDSAAEIASVGRNGRTGKANDGGPVATFSLLLREAALRNWGVCSGESFIEKLHDVPAVRNLNPDTVNAIAERADALYEGRAQALDESGRNLAWDAVLLMVLVKVRSADVERVLPALTDLIFTDAVRSRDPALAALLRKTKVFTLAALDAAYDDEVFSPAEKQQILAAVKKKPDERSGADSNCVDALKDRLAHIPGRHVTLNGRVAAGVVGAAHPAPMA